MVLFINSNRVLGAPVRLFLVKEIVVVGES